MKEKLDFWTVDTVDLTGRVAAAIGGAPPPAERELFDELRALRRELAELRSTTAVLRDEVARLRLAAVQPAGARRIVPFGPAEGRVRLS